MAASMAQAPPTWILTGSPENFAATRERGFTLIGVLRRHRHRSQALEMEPGGRTVFSLTRIGRLDELELLLERMRAASGVRA
jgi:hypothetical protein